MKKKIIVTLVALMVMGVPTYFIPILIAKGDARSLYGNFDIGNQCMGGHEIFLLLEEKEAFMNCPGHLEKKELGKVLRTKKDVTIFYLDGVTPWARIDYDGSNHYITVLEPKGEAEELDQVVSPWRLWLPAQFSEEH